MIILSNLIKHEMSIFEAYEAIKKIKTLKIFAVEFEGLYPVGNCLILSAYTISQAQKMAKKIINHTDGRRRRKPGGEALPCQPDFFSHLQPGDVQRETWSLLCPSQTFSWNASAAAGLFRKMRWGTRAVPGNTWCVARASSGLAALIVCIVTPRKDRSKQATLREIACGMLCSV